MSELIHHHEDINEWIKHWRPTEFVSTNPDLTIKQLREELEEQWALRDLPRKMFSIKVYLDHMACDFGKDYLDACMIVRNKELELTNYDWSATRDKYREYFKHQYKTIPK